MLPAALPTWRLHTLADGVALVPPEGPQLGALRIRERLRPLRSAARIFAEAAGHLAATAREDGPIERIVTVEGEHAAIQVLRGNAAGDPFVRCLGVVFGDDSYCLVDAATTVPAHFAFFERSGRVFTSYLSLGLGHRRHRRFGYTPPAGWHAIPRGLDALWLAPGFPDDRATVSVLAARPAGDPPEAVLADLLAGERLDGLTIGAVGAAEPVFTSGELSGTRWRVAAEIDGEAVPLDAFVLEDDRFVYPIIGRRARDVVERLARTARAIPLPEPQAGQDALLHWAT